jgi:hypothetical protein
VTGRPTRCTELLTAAVLKHIRTGSTESLAVKAEGISAQSWSVWQQKAARGMEPYVTFVESVTSARARYLCNGVAVINAHAYGDGDPEGGDWKAQAWLHERTAPDEFGASQTIILKARDEATAMLIGMLRSATYPLRSFADVLALLDPDGAEDDETHPDH